MLPVLHPHGLILYFLPGVVTCCLKWLLSCQESWYLPGQMGKCCRCNPSNKRLILFFFHYLPLQPHRFCSEIKPSQKKKPGMGKNTFFLLPRAAGSGVIFYTSASSRGVCIIAWKSGKNLPAWEAVSGKTRLLQLFLENMGSGKQQEERQDLRGGKTQRGKKKKAVLKQENSLLEEKE